MGLEIEFEYADSPDEVWSAERTRPAREWLSRSWTAGSLLGNPLIVHLGIALAALALGAASTAGFLIGRTAAHDRSVTLLHLAPVDAFVVPALPAPTTPNQSPDQLLATPWTNVADQDVSLALINDGPDPVTMLGATISSLDFDVTDLTPASTAPTAPGGVSTLRGRAHFVCGDYPADRIATVANLRARTADGLIHRETLEVDRFSEIAEQSVCARIPTPQIIRSTTFSPAPPSTPSKIDGLPDISPVYVAKITASNRASFPLRMDLPQSAIQSWAGAGLDLTASGDTIIQPHGTGTIAISVSISDCPSAVAAASGAFSYDLLAFSDGRDPVGYAQLRSIDQTIPITDASAIMTHCLAHGATPGGVVSR